MIEQMKNDQNNNQSKLYSTSKKHLCELTEIRDFTHKTKTMIFFFLQVSISFVLLKKTIHTQFIENNKMDPQNSTADE